MSRTELKRGSALDETKLDPKRRSAIPASGRQNLADTAVLTERSQNTPSTDHGHRDFDSQEPELISSSQLSDVHGLGATGWFQQSAILSAVRGNIRTPLAPPSPYIGVGIGLFCFSSIIIVVGGGVWFFTG